MRSIDTASSAQRGSAPVPSQGAKNKASAAMGSPSKKQAVAYRESDRTTAANRSAKRGTSMRPVPQKGGPSGGYQTGRVKAPSNQAQRLARQAEMSMPKRATSKAVLRKASAAMGGMSKKQVVGSREAAMRFDKKMTYGRYPGRKG